MIKGFFFDLDGTLVDTHRANFDAYRQALEAYGVTLQFDDFKKSIGHQARVFLPWFAPGLSKEDYESIATRKRQFYKKSARLSMLNIQLVDFIREIKPRHTIALVTTAKKDNALTILDTHQLDDLFDTIITAEDVTQSKPSPECYEKALQQTGLRPSEVIAFEDSEPGMQAARQAGIAVIQIKDYHI